MSKLTISRAKRFGLCIRSLCKDLDQHGAELGPSSRKQVKRQTTRIQRRKTKLALHSVSGSDTDR